jgi:hypothetical protein
MMTQSGKPEKQTGGILGRCRLSAFTGEPVMGKFLAKAEK